MIISRNLDNGYLLSNIQENLTFYRIHDKNISIDKKEWQILDHFCALKSSELRRNSLSEIKDVLNINSVIKYLDPNYPSFYALILLLLKSDIENYTDFLLKCLYIFIEFSPAKKVKVSNIIFFNYPIQDLFKLLTSKERVKNFLFQNNIFTEDDFRNFMFSKIERCI